MEWSRDKMEAEGRLFFIHNTIIMTQRQATEVESDRSFGIISLTREMYLTASGGRLSFVAASEDNENGGKFMEFRIEESATMDHSEPRSLIYSSRNFLEARSFSSVDLAQFDGDIPNTAVHWTVKKVRDNLFSIESESFLEHYLTAVDKQFGYDRPALTRGDPSTDDDLLWKLTVLTSEDPEVGIRNDNNDEEEN